MNRLKTIQLSILLFFIATSLNSCEVVGGIFKAGVWVGVIVVVAIIALILYLVGRRK